MSEWFVCFDKTEWGIIMAKFWFEDDRIMSGDKYMDMLDGGEDPMENTNRDYISLANEYDLLIKIQMLIEAGGTCVLSVFDKKPDECTHECSSCIQTWLNHKKS